MTIKRMLIRLLDRPAGRPLLRSVATRVARRASGADVELLYDDAWIHRVGPHFFPDGRRFTLTTYDFQQWPDQATRHRSEAEDYWFHFGRPRPGDVVIDIGAGQGEDTMAFAEAVGPLGRVLAIEAHPESFRMLELFCRHNRLTNATPLHRAVMDRPGEISMVEHDVWTANAVTPDGGPSDLQVRAETLEAICDAEEVGEVGFLKMNIEGAERQALPGAASVLPRVRRICVACHDFRADHGHSDSFRTRAFVEGFLADHGFRVSRRADDPRCYVRDHVFGTRGD